MPTNARLWLGYGPAECTVYATAHLVSTHDVQNGSIPIGRPLSDYECLILDEQLHQVSDGQHGELVIGGKFISIFRTRSCNHIALIYWCKVIVTSIYSNSFFYCNKYKWILLAVSSSTVK